MFLQASAAGLRKEKALKAKGRVHRLMTDGKPTNAESHQFDIWELSNP